jgi:hypothetical protein
MTAPPTGLQCGVTSAYSADEISRVACLAASPEGTYSANAIAEVSQQTNGALRVKMHDKQL